MAPLFGVAVSMPKKRTGWQPAMVRTVGNVPMVEIWLAIRKARICPGFQGDPRAEFFVACAEELGPEWIIQAWEEAAGQFYKPETGYRHRSDNG
jgi:hypothetical protein